MAVNGCCPIELVEAIMDFSQPTGCLNFLERTGIIAARRGPNPLLAPQTLKVHRIPLSPPLPLPSLQMHLNGVTPPDRGQTQEWPFPGESSV